MRARGALHAPYVQTPRGRSFREGALFVSRWSIRRKLLVCLAIVLAIVAALAYSGFSGGYSYKRAGLDDPRAGDRSASGRAS